MMPDGEVCGLCEACAGPEGYFERACGAVHACEFCELKRRGVDPLTTLLLP